MVLFGFEAELSVALHRIFSALLNLLLHYNSNSCLSSILELSHSSTKSACIVPSEVLLARLIF